MTQREFSTAMRLIALAQQGQTINEATLDQTMGVKAPFPKFTGVELPPPASAKQPTYTITSEARAQYEKLWNTLDKNPSTGLLEGKDAAAFFAKSGQHRDVLRQVWQMSDLNGDGAMDFSEFTIGMHLTMLAKKGFDLPSSLPQELLQSAAPTAVASNSNDMNISTLNFSTLNANFSTLMENDNSNPSSYFPSPPPPVALGSSTFSRLDEVYSTPPQLNAFGNENLSLDRSTVQLQDSANKFQSDCEKFCALDEECTKLREQVQVLNQQLQAKHRLISQQQDEIRLQLQLVMQLALQFASTNKSSNNAFSNFE